MKMETKAENPNGTCSRYFGYLSQISREKVTPDECLTCKKLIDCRLSKSDSHTPKIEPETMIIEEKLTSSVEEPVIAAEKKNFDEAEEFQNIAKPSRVDLAGEQFAVENLGVLYSKWSETVLINKETLSGWGAKIKEVDIQTDAGRKMRCKVMSSEDPRKEVILIPEKIQLKLEIRQGDLVTVHPIVLLELENKANNIVQTFYSLKKIGLRSARKYKKMTQKLWRNS